MILSIVICRSRVQSDCTKSSFQESLETEIYIFSVAPNCQNIGTSVPIIDSQMKLFSPLKIEDVTASNWVRLHFV